MENIPGIIVPLCSFITYHFIPPGVMPIVGKKDSVFLCTLLIIIIKVLSQLCWCQLHEFFFLNFYPYIHDYLTIRISQIRVKLF